MVQLMIIVFVYFIIDFNFTKIQTFFHQYSEFFYQMISSIYLTTDNIQNIFIVISTASSIGLMLLVVRLMTEKENNNYYDNYLNPFYYSEQKLTPYDKALLKQQKQREREEEIRQIRSSFKIVS